MPTCPYCKADLSEADLKSRHCSTCDRTLPLDEADEERIAKTLDASTLPELPPSEAETPTADEKKIAKTLDASTPPAPPPSEADPANLDEVAEVWASMHQPDATPRSTIKPDASPVVTESNLIIQPRVIRDRGEADSGTADYELLGKLGDGGIGVVHFARQASIDRTVAVKELRPEYAKNRDKREEFLAEAIVTGELEHPNIVPIYDLLTTDKDVLFYSMKRVQGTPWDEVISRRSTQENLDALMKIADAVAFAHSRGVVHRDLKPENVMLGDYGEVLLMDWGLAIAPSKAKGSGMGGTPAYMAPEMATGPIQRVGFHSDVYLLGAILFEIITGTTPHTGTTVTLCVLAAAKNEIQPTDKSGELLDIAMKAMAKEPEDRFAGVTDFQAAIREYQAHSESISLSTRAEEDLAEAREKGDYQAYARALFGFEEALSLWDANERARSGGSETTLAYARSALDNSDYDLGASLLDTHDPSHADLCRKIAAAKRERDARQQRLKNAKRMGVGLLALLLIVITGFSFWVQAKERRARNAETVAKVDRDRAIAAEKTTGKERDRAKAAEATARNAETRAKNERDRARREKAAADLAKKVAIAAQNKEAYGAYIARIGLAASKIEENAFVKANDLLEECRPTEYCNWEWGRLKYLCTRAYREFNAEQPIEAVAFSRDGKRFVTGGWGGIARVWDVESGKQVATITTEGDYLFAVAFSPDGRHIATGSDSRPNYVEIWDAATGASVMKIKGHENTVLSVEYSPSGKYLLSGSYDETARLWYAATGREIRAFRGHDGWVCSASFSPDERRIVTASQDGSARVWDIDSDELKPPFSGHKGPVYAAAFSPDGLRVASAGYDKRVLVWKPDDVEPFNYEVLTNDKVQNPTPKYEKLEGHTAGVHSVQFSHDGQYVLSGGNDNTVRIWNATTYKLEKTLRGHGGRVLSCRFSPDDKKVLSGSYDQMAKIWNFARYEEVRVFGGSILQGHEDAILGAAFARQATDHRVVSASRDRTARTWDVNSGEFIEFKEGHAFLASAGVFFPDGKRVLTSAIDGTTRIWDVRTGTQLLSLDETGGYAAVALAHDAKWIVTGGDKEEIAAGGDRYAAKLFSVEIGKDAAAGNDDQSERVLRKLAHDRFEVTAVAISPDDRLVFTGDAAGTCRLWNAETGEKLRELNGHTDAITDACFLPNGQRVLTSSTDTTVAQWDVKTGKERQDLVLRHPNDVVSLAVSPDGRLALTACTARTRSRPDPDSGKMIATPISSLVHVWDIEKGTELATLPDRNELISHVAFSREGQRAVTTSSDRTVRLWDMATRQEISIHVGRPFVDLEEEGQMGWSAVFSPDGTQVLTVGGDSAHLRNAAGVEMMSFSPHESVASAHFSPDGKYIVTGSWDMTAKIWESRRNLARLKLEGHTGQITSVAYSPDGSQVLTASKDKTARLWDAATGEELLIFKGHTKAVRSAVFSSDGRLVATTSDDKTARIWNAATGESLRELVGHRQAVLCAAFSPHNDRVVTGSEDNSAKLWDVATGKEVSFAEEKRFGLEGHSASITSVAFSSDGSRVITGSRDNTAKIWELINGEEILTLSGHSREVTCVDFAPDGRSILTGSRDGTMILWLADPPPPVAKSQDGPETQEAEAPVNDVVEAG